MSTSLTIEAHDTAPMLYDCLARVFGEEEYGQTRWVSLTHDGVVLHFYAPKPTVAPDKHEA